MTRRKVTRGAPPQMSRSHKPRAASAARGERGRTRVRESGDDESGLLNAYFRDMSGLDVMTPEEEVLAAIRIVEARRVLWEALLALPAMAPAVCGAIEACEELAEQPTGELAAVRQALAAAGARGSKATRVRWEAASSALAARMATLDGDGLVSGALVGAAACAARGERANRAVADIAAEVGQAPWRDYVGRTQRAAEALRQAKNDFVAANLRLVVSIARRFNHGRMSLQDLIQEGNIGLMKAVDRFDHARGFRFSTYGSWWIRHAITRALADKGRAVRLPVHMLDAHQRVARARREFEGRHGRDPSPAELATLTQIPVEKLERLLEVSLDTPVSLDRTLSDDDGRRAVDFLEDTDSPIPGEAMEAEALNKQVHRLLAGLRPIEADILRKRFGLAEAPEFTLKEIGSQYDLSRERIRQLQEQALGKIRRELERLELL